MADDTQKSILRCFPRPAWLGTAEPYVHALEREIDQWRMLAEMIWYGSHFKVVGEGTNHAHLNNNRGTSYGDIEDEHGNVVLSVDRQVEMVSGWEK